MMYRSLLSFAFIALLVNPLTTYGQNTIRQPKDDLELVLSLPKAEFVEGEPIVVTVSVGNRANATKRLAEPSVRYSTLEFRVARTGGGPKPEIAEALLPGPPSDFGWEFRPGEGRGTTYDLQSDFIDSLPVGNYCVKGTYYVPDSVSGVWHGTIVTPGLCFAIVPAGDSEQAPAAFKAARAWASSSSKSELLSARSSLDKLDDRKRGGRFADYAGYFSAETYRYGRDMTGFVARIRSYLANHPAVPYYSELARIALGKALCSEGQYEEAVQDYQQLPDGYERRDLIAKCTRKRGQSQP